MITNEELVFVSGGDMMSDAGRDDANAARGGAGIDQDMQMNPIIIAAVIAAVGAIVVAAINAFNSPSVPEVTVKTTEKCSDPDPDTGEQTCWVTGKETTKTTFKKQ